MSRFTTHSADEQQKLHTDLPKYFFQDIFTLLEKYFDQWWKPNLACAAFLSESALAKHFASWVLGHLTQDASIKHNFINRIMHVPSFIMFASKIVSCFEISEKIFLLNIR